MYFFILVTHLLQSSGSKQSLTKVYKLLSFLKENTDKKHPTTQEHLRELAGLEYAKEIFGDKGTFSRRLKALADALNTRQDGSPLPKDEWKLVYPGYTKGDGAKNGKIYYSQPVSDFELEFLLNQIDSSLDFTIEEKDSLKKRLMNTLSSKYFKQGSFDKNALVQNPSREVEAAELLPLQYKLSTIRKHILSKEMLELEVVDGDDKENSMNIRVSPYRIIKKDHKLWLICNWHDRPVESQAWPRYTDDLTSIDISNIISLSTAQTPDETYIHWTSTRALLPGQSYTRISYANRITKARYGDKIKENLKKFDENIPTIELKHMKDN